MVLVLDLTFFSRKEHIILKQLHKVDISFGSHAQFFFQYKMTGSLKRKRVEAPRIPTFEDVHPHTSWTLCVRVFHKFHVERIAPGRKRLYMVLLDEKV
jgi:hypothetical protein